MKKMIRYLIDKVRGIRSKLRYKKAIKNMDADGTQLFIDIGSSSIKASIGNEYISFRASVREVTNRNELTIANNVMCVDGRWFVVSENITPVQNVTMKYQKENLNVLVLYSIKLLSEKIGNIDLNCVHINTMLPFNQLHTVDQLKKVINGVYTVKDLRGNHVTITMSLKNVQCEGETSLVYFNSVHSNKCDNTIVLNIGNSTIDCITFDNVQNARQDLSTINQGTNLLLSNYLKHLPQIPNSSLLGSFLKSGKFKFSKEEQQYIQQENIKYLKGVWFDIQSLVKKVNPYSTNIIITGGGAMVLQEAIREFLGNRYNIIVGNNQECLYSDLMGLKLICNNGNEITNKNIPANVEEVPAPVEIVEANEEIQLTMDAVQETQVDAPKTNFDLFIMLREQGYTLKQIHEGKMLELTYNSLKNYNCKYNKLRVV